MSLDFNVTKIKNKDTVTTDPRDATKWNPVTEALVWLSINCGYREISEKNAADVYARIRASEKCLGAMLKSRDADHPITFEHVHQHIGLTTNASVKTKAQFIKWLGMVALDNAEGEANREIKERDQAARTVLLKAAKQDGKLIVGTVKA